MAHASRMRPLTLLFVPMALAWLSGCNEDIGSYRLEAVRLVNKQISPMGGSPAPYPEYLEVELSSETDIVALELGNGPYAHADFCNLTDREGITALGPLLANGERLLTERGAGRHAPDPRDGRFRYFVYVVPSYPAPGVRYSSTHDSDPEYNLRRANTDLCLWFAAPGYQGYFAPPARSNMVTVPANLVDAALRSNTISATPTG